MKKPFVFFILAAWPLATLLGQSIDYNRIVLPEHAANVSFEERLVQLAWSNNPASHIALEEVITSEEEFKVQRSQWSSMMGVTGNLNEFNVKALSESDAAEGNLFFPRYNFFVQLPLSLIVEKPHQKKAARSRLRASQHRVNLLKLELRSRVLKLYSEYKKSEVIWTIRRQTTADEESNYLLVEQKFKSGDAPVEEYIQAQRGLNDSKIQLAIAENDYKKAKIDLEEVIGIPLEEVK